MNGRIRCSRCGAELPADARPGGLCAACLMNLALDEVVDAEASREADAGRLEVSASLGTSIGPYKLDKVLGEGGMGIVYLARQEQPIRRQVALKIIKLGMDSREVLDRFAIERQALALMDHPNVARVLDAGATPEGRPYFVMEYVPGVPITEYCDHRRLGFRRRIDLFIGVCDAVQHAHQKGIIHRDIKPSNVLVTEQDGRSVPKVIDFGLAKATEKRLAERTAFTQLGQLIGTPEYMSPEQARLTGEEVDTRTDLYSLGILLYELLAGVTPLDADELRRAGLEGMLRRIRDDASPTPSSRVSSMGEAGTRVAEARRTDPTSLMRRLQGDLDWIVMKAIEKERPRRYSTVQELAADLQRHLDDEPVLAGPPGAVYRTTKFVRRHRLGVYAAGGILLALLAGVSGATGGWVRATRAEGRARQAETEAQDSEASAREEAQAAQEVSNFLVGLFNVSTPGDVPVDTITAREILERGAEKIRNELSEQPLVQARMMFTIAEVYFKLGLLEEARALAEEGLRLREQERPADHREIAASLNQVGGLLWELGDHDQAEEMLTKLLEVNERTLAPDDPAWTPGLSNTVGLYLDQGRFSEAEPLARRALVIADNDAASDAAKIATQNNLGLALLYLGQFEEAEELFMQALETKKRLFGENHVNVASALNNMANLYYRQGRNQEAEPLFEKIIAIQEENLGEAHPDLASTVTNLAINHAVQGRYDEAEPQFRRVVEIWEEVVGPEHLQVGRSLVNLASINRDLGRYDEAESLYLRALGIMESTVGPDQPDVATLCGNLAGLYHRMGREKESEALNRRALEIRKQAFGPEHPRVAMSLDNVAAAVRDRGALAEAEPMFLEALAIREKAFEPDHPLIAKSLHGIGMLYREQGRHDEAEPLFQRAIAIREAKLGADHPDVASTLKALAISYRLQARYDEAEPLFKQALAIMDAKFEPENPEIREFLEAYATLLREIGRDSEAEALESRIQRLGS